MFNPSNSIDIGLEYRLADKVSLDLAYGRYINTLIFKQVFNSCGYYINVKTRYYTNLDVGGFVSLDLTQSNSFYSSLATFNSPNSSITKNVDINRISSRLHVSAGFSGVPGPIQWPMEFFFGLGLERRTTNFLNLTELQFDNYNAGGVSELEHEKFGHSINLSWTVGIKIGFKVRKKWKFY
jgi:hypothetical protein